MQKCQSGCNSVSRSAAFTSCYQRACGLGFIEVHIVSVNCCSIRSGQPEQARDSSLKYQTRCIRSYPNGTGYALSSIEGRVAMEYFDNSEQAQARKYAFKCHRKSEAGRDVVFPVNAIAFHPTFGTFATGGRPGLRHPCSTLLLAVCIATADTRWSPNWTQADALSCMGCHWSHCCTVFHQMIWTATMVPLTPA